jgi:hypothetical protein
MKLAFDKQCDCAEIEAFYPKPSISSRAPNIADPLAYVEISFSCPICGNPWSEIIANNFGESSGPPIGKKLIISDPHIARKHG